MSHRSTHYASANRKRFSHKERRYEGMKIVRERPNFYIPTSFDDPHAEAHAEAMSFHNVSRSRMTTS